VVAAQSCGGDPLLYWARGYRRIANGRDE